MGGQHRAVLAFNGFWRHKGAPEVVERIAGEEIRGPDGTVTKITAEGVDTVSFCLRGKKYTGQRFGDELRWDDGDVWQALDNFDGLWNHKRNPHIVEVIKGDEIHGPDGTVTQIVAHGPLNLSFRLGGRVYSGRRHGDELVWDDGDIWVLQRQQRVPAVFDGEWQHKMDPRLKEVIRGSTIYGPDGTETRIIAQSYISGIHQLAFAFGGRTYTGQLRGDQLMWDDGDIWLRVRMPQACADLLGAERKQGDYASVHEVAAEAFQPPNADLLGHERNEEDLATTSEVVPGASNEMELAKIFEQGSPVCAANPCGQSESRASELARVFQPAEERLEAAASDPEGFSETVNDLSFVFQRAEAAPPPETTVKNEPAGLASELAVVFEHAEEQSAGDTMGAAGLVPSQLPLAAAPRVDDSPPVPQAEPTAEEPTPALDDMEKIFKKQVDGL